MARKTLRKEARSCTVCFMISITTLLTLGALMLVFRVVGFEPVFQAIVNTQVALVKGTLSYEQWLAPTPAIYKIARMYNIENSDDVLAGGDPNVTTMGPYYFREYREKIDVMEVNDEEIWFHEKKWYVFDSNKTGHGLDPDKDLVHTINIAYVAIAYNLSLTPGSEIEEDVIDILSKLTSERSLFMKRTVNEILFGYEDSLLKAVALVMTGLPTKIQIVKNMSIDDIEQWSIVKNGRYKPYELGQYTKWQGMRSLPWWKTKEANTVNGTEGLFFNPNLNKTHILGTLLADDIFRSSVMEYFKEEVLSDINTYVYRIPKYSMDNATSNPNNAGFYSNLPNGLMNLTSPTHAPVIISKPSFLDAEPWLAKEVSGMPPPDRTMDTNIWVEPITGCLVNALKQLQLNMMIEHNQHFFYLSKLRVKPRYIPFCMIQETGGMDDALIKTFKGKVFVPRLIFLIAVYCVAGVAILCSLVLLLLLFRYVRINQDEDEASKLLLPGLIEDENPNLV